MKACIELIVLGHTRTGENSLVIHTLSKEYGRRGFLLRGVKRGLMARLLPLSIIEGRVSPNPKSSLWNIGGIVTVHPLGGIRSDMYKNSMTMFMSEVLYRVIKDGVNEDGLYDWCKMSVLTLDSLPGGFSNYHIRFLLSLAAALGFRADRRSMEPFARHYPGKTYSMIELPFAEAMLVPMSGEERSVICRQILRYIEHHSESALNVRSLEVLQEIFH